MAPISTRLTIAGFEPLDQSSHWFNELVSFKIEASALGLAVRILVPRGADLSLVTALSADARLEPLPAMDVNAGNFVSEAVTYADAADVLTPLWEAVEDLGPADLLYFPRGHPILIRAVGVWLAARAPKRRPSVFFRIIGDELTDLDTGHFRQRAVFYRIACADLATRAGQERVFFLVNSKAKARTVSRVFKRRPFMMQHHFGGLAGKVLPTEPATPVIYVHLNDRSGRIASNLGDIIQRVIATRPDVKFLVHGPAKLSEPLRSIEPAIVSAIDILPYQLSTADYIANLARSTLIFLAYEAQPYRALTSGVFTEAASLGKPVVVPAGTWMAEKIVEGFGVGPVFNDHTVEAVAAVILGALNASDELGASARAIAPRLQEETGCRVFIERMIALSQASPDMEPRYEIGDEIHFDNALDSRGFMQNGWGGTEHWGVWTVAEEARLVLRLEAHREQVLVLNVFARAFLGDGRKPRVRVSCAGRQIAEWIFESQDYRWLTALLPAYDGKPGPRSVDLLFAIDAPSSPFAHGLSDDRRMLGLGLCKLSLTSAARVEPPEQAASSRSNVFARALRRVLPG
jgi:glycosyltransferase involved in cell wall biosynthesis